MHRRHFLRSGLSLASLLALGPARALAQMSLAETMDTAMAPMLTDNDEFPLEEGGRPDMRSANPFSRPVAYGLKYFTFEEVSVYLSPFIESSFEMFFFANTDIKGQSSDFVPYQHMKVIRKKNPSLPVFQRDSSGRIVGFTDNAELWATIPVSSGRGSPKILTYSGLFRFNLDRTLRKKGTNESINANMSWSTYVDFIYCTGVESGVAIHGTPPRNHHLLGKSRASEGCLRVHPETAKKVRELLLSPSMISNSLPAFSQTSQLPSRELMMGQVESRPGIKAMIMIFNGYRAPGKMV